MTHKFTEQTVLAGTKRSLVGIMTRSSSVQANMKPTVVILNTGIIHRIGHHRMSVALARLLAVAGFNVLRFDFAGVGDSEPRVDGLSPLESSLADLNEVMDWLERERGTSSIVLVGHCSGADHAILHGHSDPRVVGLVLMDPSIPTTVRFYAQYILRHLTRLRSYISVALGRSGLLRIWLGQLLYGLRSNANMRPATLNELRFHKYLGLSYRNAIANGVQILAVFTGDTSRQTYHDQMLDAFPGIAFGDQLNLKFFQGADHLFSSERDRTRLFNTIINWMLSMHDEKPGAQARLAPEIEQGTGVSAPADDLERS
jgi:pimeloyl-ACP methyl ester carboxylesterase